MPFIQRVNQNSAMDDINHDEIHNDLADGVEGAGYGVRVTDYGVLADGLTDDTNGLEDAVAATPEGGKLYLGPGIHRGRLVVQDKRITIQGTGQGTVIKANSADAAVDIDMGLNYNAGIQLKNLRVINEGTGPGIALTGFQRSRINDVYVINAGTAGWVLKDCILNQFDNCGVTVNDDYPVGENGSPAIGLQLTKDAFGCYINTFNNFVAEGCSDAGIDIVEGIQNLFSGGTSEGNGIGIRFAASPPCRNNIFMPFWLEANGTNISGSLGNNTVFYLDGSGYTYEHLGDYVHVASQIDFGNETDSVREATVNLHRVAASPPHLMTDGEFRAYGNMVVMTDNDSVGSVFIQKADNDPVAGFYKSGS